MNPLSDDFDMEESDDVGLGFEIQRAGYRREARMQEVMGGATRSEKKPNYNQIPSLALRRLAVRFSVGAVQYDDPDEARKLHGAMNWQGGDEEFFRDAFNHMVDHLYAWKDGDRSDDHLAAVMWGCAVQMWHEEQTAGGPPPQA